MIDPEFATYGPFGFDIGQFIANLLLNALSREEEKKCTIFPYRKDVELFCRNFYKVMDWRRCRSIYERKQWLPIILQNIFTDAVGFAGCELIRRTIGLAHVADLDEIENKETRIQAKKQALSLGKELIKYESKSADIQLFRTLFQQTVSGA